ncbi:unnamed protein product [Bemisia tabaci]|uniref:Multiple inositol polyphosphate phosphatase 1 n=2 Tax=Bemisia tabaci TaxID=7038 RepID=A0A9P0EY49_BEMTA|nr:unnamed protein product [Bemisia tabaci]
MRSLIFCKGHEFVNAEMRMGLTAWFLLVLSVTLLSAAGVLSDDYHCYAEDSSPYLFFGSKTAYQFVRDKNNIKPVPDCLPVQIWILSRHGTRYPDLKEIKRLQNLTAVRELILQNHDARATRLCDRDVDGLRRWHYNLRPEQDNQITSQGHEDLLFLAKKLKSNFPELLDVPYSESKFDFRTTAKQRTIDSAKAFAEGLFPGVDVRIPPPPVPDRFLNIHHNCSSYETSTHNPDTKREVAEFQKSHHYWNLIMRVSSRLGFKYNLTPEFIDMMYEMCRYEKAWHISAISPWCAVFTPDELKVLEYEEDLKHWYKAGYGNADMSAKVGCIIVRDLLTHFDAVIKNGSTHSPMGVFRFSHSGLMLPTLVKLGMAKDNQKLTAKNYDLLGKREWKTSMIDPFGANLMAVLYRCNTGEEYKVIFYQNERVVNYPGCDVGLCSWTYLQNQLRSAFTCTTDFCNSSSVPKISLVYTVFLLLLNVLYFK